MKSEMQASMKWDAVVAWSIHITGFAAQNRNEFPDSLSLTSQYPNMQTSVRRQHKIPIWAPDMKQCA